MNSIESSILISSSKTKTACLLFLFLTCIFLLTGQGSIQSTDGKIMFFLTKSIVEEGKLSFKDEVFFGQSGQEQFSKYGIGMSLLAIPFYVLGKIFSFFLGIEEYYTTLFSVSMINALLTALSSVVLFRLCRDRFNWTDANSLVLTLGFGLSTMSWAYSEGFMSEPATTLFLLCAVYFLTHPENVWQNRILCGTFLGLALLYRLSAGITLPGFFIYQIMLWKDVPDKSLRSRISELLQMGLPILLFLCLIFIYNYLRYQNIFETGYEKGFVPDFWTGLLGNLFSPGKSVFLYNPVIIMGCLAFPRFFKSHPRYFYFFSWIIFSNLFLYSFWVGWHGGWAWGPRMMTPVLPYLVLPVGFWLVNGSQHTKKFVYGLMALGMVLQISSVTVNPARYYYNLDSRFNEKAHDLLIYSPAYSPLIGQFKEVGVVFKNMGDKEFRKNLVRQATSKKTFLGENSTDVLENGLSVNAPNFWWYYMYLFGYPFYLTILPPLILLFTAIYCGFRIFMVVKMSSTSGSFSK